MTREQAKELLPIIQAYAEGKVIQYRHKGRVAWYDLDSGQFNCDMYSYRIKPEPKFRPFRNTEECWQEMQKHQPFGWVKSKRSERLFSIGLVLWNNEFNDVSVTFACDGMLGRLSKSMFEDFTFADGTPFGINEE